MDESVEEAEQTQHSAKADKRAPTADPPQRGYAQGDHQKTEGPDTRPIADIFERIRAQAPCERIVEKPHERDEAGEENDQFENPPATEFGHYGSLLASGPPSGSLRYIASRPPYHRPVLPHFRSSYASPYL